MSPKTDPRGWSRREFLRAGSMTIVAGLATGCAKNPVTGQSQFMLISEEQEIKLDQQASPQQLSTDYGTSRDQDLSGYVSGVGMDLAHRSHRPQMPYSFNVVNANYVNAYAFPGGTIACTRGILLEVDNEAELAALMGHEIGHVNARHTASRMSSQVAIGTIAGVGGAVVGAKFGGGWGALAGGVGGLGAGLLLASYSRNDERQADDLGMEYMTRAGYNPDGMVGLMEMLNDRHDAQPSALAVMFATHPMSSERLATARRQAREKYYGTGEYKIYRERYMDNTAYLRAMKPAVKEMQEAEKLAGQKKYDQAEAKMRRALSMVPEDYTGLMIMAKLHTARKNYDEALAYVEHARAVYPEEPQGAQLAGVLQLQGGRYERAFTSFQAYDRALPGNPYTGFFMGYSQERMGDREQAARRYYQFLQSVNSGDEARYAYGRLVQWGYTR